MVDARFVNPRFKGPVGDVVDVFIPDEFDFPVNQKKEYIFTNKAHCWTFDYPIIWMFHRVSCKFSTEIHCRGFKAS